MPTTAMRLDAGTWIVDPVHSDITFRVRHMGVGRVHGTFAVTLSELTVTDAGTSASGVRAVLDAASVVTGNAQRDRHIRSADFLDTENHPTLEFASTRVSDLKGDCFTVAGDLTIHGVTHAVELAAECLGTVDDPSGGQRTGFSATTTTSRAAFGVDIHLAFSAAGVVVADIIEVTVDIEFTHKEVEQA